MNATKPQGSFCQSCSMPMEKVEDFGTNANGSRNLDYCHYCYQKGAFTTPNATVDEMIAISTGAMQKMHMPENLIAQTKIIIPTLKRWTK